METYNGTTNLYNHLEGYKSLMMLQGTSDALMCKSFSMTLRDTTWANSIHSLQEFGYLFVA